MTDVFKKFSTYLDMMKPLHGQLCTEMLKVFLIHISSVKFWNEIQRMQSQQDGGNAETPMIGLT